MPISECDGLDAAHWADVLAIIESAAKEAGYEARLVSDTFESNLIHKEILQNIYHDEVVVCDVSGRNPNVFFELGIRMATQKPTVIVKDDETDYPFDTGPNRYIGYPRDLRHPKMEQFRNNLKVAIEKTAVQPKENSFIGQLGPFQIPDVESTEVPAMEAVLSRLSRIENRLSEPRPSAVARQLNSLRTGEEVDVISMDPKLLLLRATGYNNEQVQNGIDDLLKANKGARDVAIELKSLSGREHIISISGDWKKKDLNPSLIRRAIDTAIPF